MAERQRRPEREQKTSELVNQMREFTERVRQAQLTPAQREVMITIVEEMARYLTRLPVVIPRQMPPREGAQRQEPETESRTRPQSPQGQRVPHPTTRRAPVRIEQFQYLVTLLGAGGNSTSYLVTLPERLPTRPDGSLDTVAAQERLHGMLLNNELVRTDPNNPNTITLRAQVTMRGGSPQTIIFNESPPNYRLDTFRDSYLGRTYTGGQYVPSGQVVIAEVAPQREQRR